VAEGEEHRSRRECRICAAKTPERIVPLIRTEVVQERIKRAQLQLHEDKDMDIRFFAETALQCSEMSLHLSLSVSVVHSR